MTAGWTGASVTCILWSSHCNDAEIEIEISLMLNGIQSLLICPRCGATAAEGLNVQGASCGPCNLRFFSLNGLPCWFPNGEQQRVIWQDLYAKLEEEKKQLEHLHELESRFIGLLPATKQRLDVDRRARLKRLESVATILENSGLQPLLNSSLQNLRPAGFVQYYELMLRDWAWFNAEDANRQDENRLMLQQIVALTQTDSSFKPRRILVLGAGAGRLSWDLYNHWTPELLVTVDHNPLLAYTAKHLIRDMGSFTLWEVARHDTAREAMEIAWDLTVPQFPGQHSSRNFHVLAADAWNLPLAPGSFDLIVTPWFIDIVGGDFKDLLGKLQPVLRPEGYWLNYGPLKYYDGMPEQHKYSHKEISELLNLAGFSVHQQAHFDIPYVRSPLVDSARTESVWGYFAQLDTATSSIAPVRTEKLQHGENPAWLILPHLPIPPMRISGVPDWVENIFAFIDGHRSINDLAALVAPSMPADYEPRQFVFDVFQGYALEP